MYFAWGGWRPQLAAVFQWVLYQALPQQNHGVRALVAKVLEIAPVTL